MTVDEFLSIPVSVRSASRLPVVTAFDDCTHVTSAEAAVCQAGGVMCALYDANCIGVYCGRGVFIRKEKP